MTAIRESSRIGAGTVGPNRARAALATGVAVVLPNAAPLTYVVAGKVATGVNEAKGRPAEQAVAFWTTTDEALDELTEVVALSPATWAFARRVLLGERVTMLVPLRVDVPVPSRLAPSTREGWAMLWAARWPRLGSVTAGLGPLYVSSGNATGHLPARSAAEAVAMFPPGTPVLDAAVLPAPDPDPDEGERVDATTTVRVGTDGALSLHRHGAQDRPFPDGDAYLARVRSG